MAEFSLHSSLNVKFCNFIAVIYFIVITQIANNLTIIFKLASWIEWTLCCEEEGLAPLLLGARTARTSIMHFLMIKATFHSTCSHTSIHYYVQYNHPR